MSQAYRYARRHCGEGSRRVGDGISTSNRVELVQKRGDVELGGMNRNAEPTGDHLV